MEPIRVLLIEDNPGDVRLIREWLADVRGVPLGLEHADRLSTGLDRLAGGEIDAVLLDLSLPDSEGLKTFTRAHAHAPGVPIVVVTSLDDEGVGVKAVREGAQDYLVKGQITGPLLVRALRYAIERRQAEEQLQRQREALYQTEKLAAMGSLLAGVAHELNNPLTVIVGQTAFLRQTAGGGLLGERAERIARAAERCAEIVRDFLALARQRPPERQSVGLNQVVREAVDLLAYQLRVDSVEVRLDLAQDLPLLWADPHQLHQVVVNLVANAHQAMREAPLPRRLTVTTRLHPAQGRVSLEVADTGLGIPSKVQGRIFEPFVTTKAPGEGTGLGLPLCRGIIEGHGGSIRVESHPGQGAVFVIELPVESPLAGESEACVAEAPPPIRGQAILVVDDEPAVAFVLAEMLSADGHQVETAANGLIALDKLRDRTYDLILCDIRMPGLDGPGLYQELERRYPQLLRRIVFVTGDVLGARTQQFLAQAGAPSLNKPFSRDAIRRMVQQVLQAPGN